MAQDLADMEGWRGKLEGTSGISKAQNQNMVRVSLSGIPEGLSVLRLCLPKSKLAHRLVSSTTLKCYKKNTFSPIFTRLLHIGRAIDKGSSVGLSQSYDNHISL